MIEVIIAVDNKDAKLGAYFKMCADDLQTELSGSTYATNYRARVVYSDDLNIDFIRTLASSFENKNYVFIAYSHGNKDGLGSVDGVFYATIHSDLDHFHQSLFYTFSCYSAVNFGRSVVDAGCHLFWGYKDKASIVTTFEAYFLECTNYGIKCLLMDYTVAEAFIAMKKKFNENIKATYKLDILASSKLRANRDALVTIGNDQLYLRDLV